MGLFNIFNTINLHREAFTNNSGLGILRLFASSNKISAGELSYLFVADPIIKQVALMHFFERKLQGRIYTNIHNNEKDVIEFNFNSSGQNKKNYLDISIID
jgi:hypothetical protein